MENVCSLAIVPEDISENYLTYLPTLRQRQRADLFSREQYVHSVKIFQQTSNVFEVKARSRCYRSQRKCEQPHNICMIIDGTTKKVTQGYCSCKAGISGECAHLLGVIFTQRNWILLGLKDVPADAASTSLPQQRGNPRGNKIQSETVSTVIISRPGNAHRNRIPLMACFTDDRKAKLTTLEIAALGDTFKDTPVAYLVQGTQDMVETGKDAEYLGSALAMQFSTSWLNQDSSSPWTLRGFYTDLPQSTTDTSV